MRYAIAGSILLFGTIAFGLNNFYQQFQPFKNHTRRLVGTPTPTPTPIPVAFDSSASGSAVDSTSANTNITVSANSNRALYALVYATVSASSVSNPDINGVSTGFGNMTLVGSLTFNGGGTTLYVWRILNPTSGATTVTATTSGDSFNIILGVVDMHNVNQTTPNGSVFTNTATSTTASVSVTGTLSQSLVINIAGDVGDPAPTFTAGGGQTQMFNVSVDSAPLGGRSGGGRQTAGGTITPSWTISSSQLWGMIGIEIKP